MRLRAEAARLLAVLLLRLCAEAARLLTVLLLRCLLRRLVRRKPTLGLTVLLLRCLLRRLTVLLLRLRRLLRLLRLRVARLRAEPSLLLLGVTLLGVTRLTARRIAAARRISAARRLLHVKSSFLLARRPNLPSALTITFAKGRGGCQRLRIRQMPGCTSRLRSASHRRYARRANMTDAALEIAIVVNGEARDVPAGLTVRGLLDHLGIAGLAAVERNRELVPRARQATVLVERGDALEIVHLVGGG